MEIWALAQVRLKNWLVKLLMINHQVELGSLYVPTVEVQHLNYLKKAQNRIQMQPKKQPGRPRLAACTAHARASNPSECVGGLGLGALSPSMQEFSSLVMAFHGSWDGMVHKSCNTVYGKGYCSLRLGCMIHAHLLHDRMLPPCFLVRSDSQECDPTSFGLDTRDLRCN